jgi:hypothetical protein
MPAAGSGEAVARASAGGGNGGSTSAGGSGDSQAPTTASAATVATIYEVPPGGVLACGATPTIDLVLEPPIAPASPTQPDGSCVSGAFKHNGVCACQAGTPTVCGGTCVDTTLDPANCGACGRSCGPTSTCNAGACGPPVTNVVPPAPGCVTLNLATSGGALYWTDQGHGTVSTQPVAGCAPRTLVSGEQNPTLVTTDGATLLWLTGTTMTVDPNSYLTRTTSTIRALTLPDGEPRNLVTESNTSGGIRGLVLSADGQTLYYSTDTRVRAVPVAGGAAFDVGQEDHGGLPTALARDGNMIAFITDLNTDVDAITVEDGVVATCGDTDANGNFVGHNCLRSRGCNPSAYYGGLVLHGHTVYWGEDTGIDGATLSANVWSKDRIAEGWSDSSNQVSALAGGPDQIYFATQDADASVFRSPYTVGATAVAIARGQNLPSSMVLAGASVYWATADCAVNSSPR